jgi:putative hydrolase of the HAD superfamily
MSVLLFDLFGVIALRRLEVPAEQVLFVDDREGNLAAARALGLRGHRFTTAAELRQVLA